MFVWNAYRQSWFEQGLTKRHSPHWQLLIPLVVIWIWDPANYSCAQEPPVTLAKQNQDSPDVLVFRDDRVATLELDYVAGNPWTPFDIGDDGLGPVGYRVSWIPLRREKSVARDQTEFSRKVTSLRRVQIQPLANNEPYFVRIDYVNCFGELVGGYSSGIINGGSGRRVKQLRKRMSAFFDDFNEPAGLPNERRWNTTFSKVNDPAYQAFFINSQFHSHTLVGTPTSGYGDRGQTVHRARNPLVLNSGDTRHIVFDLDGVDVAGRSIWYLDLFQEELDISSHFSIGGGVGDFGHPSPGLRFRISGQQVSVWSLNSRGEQILIEQNNNLDWSGIQLLPNVRRAMEIVLSESHVSMKIDEQTVLDSKLGLAGLSPGSYTVHWTAFGYNTMKVNLPYMLLHWDNFGFDGVTSPIIVHNYRTQVEGTDFVQSDNYQPVTVDVEIPDDLNPVKAGESGEARLVFTRQMQTFQPAQWSAKDTVSVQGHKFPIPPPVSSADPPLSTVHLINSNAPYSSSIFLGTVGIGGTAPLIQGTNQITFESAGCGFHNVHIEVSYPKGVQPPYTPPQEIHHVPLHHQFPKFGLPARVTRIGEHEVANYMSGLSEQQNFNPIVSGVLQVGSVVNGDEFVDDITLRSNYVSPQLAGNGENPGIKRVELWMRPNGGDSKSATLIGFIVTDADTPAPQVVHAFDLDTTAFNNGVYELTLLAIDDRGIRSVPDFAGLGALAGHIDAMNGFYFPLHITIDN